MNRDKIREKKLAAYKARKGDRLIKLLAERGIDPHDFAVDCELSRWPTTWNTGLTAEDEYRRRCYQHLCRYTRADPAKRQQPSDALLVRWADMLDVDPGYFTEVP